MCASIIAALRQIVIACCLFPSLLFAAQPNVTVDPSSLGANKADINFISTINGDNHMDIVINPGGQGCAAGQVWDINVGGCTAAITLRTVTTFRACSCTCPEAGSCTASQSGSYPVYGWRTPPSGAEQISGNGATTWGSCQMVTNACTAATTPPSGGNGTPPPSGTTFIVDAFICNSGHPQYSSGPLGTTQKGQIISAYRGFNPYTARCPEVAGYVYWQNSWLSWANDWLAGHSGASLDQALANTWSTTQGSMKDAAKQNGEQDPSYSKVIDQLCSSYATNKYGVPVKASYINNSGASCIVL